MTRSARPTEKLLQVAKHGSRRQQYSASTKRALVDVAREHFATQGYAGTSLDTIVAGARVTKGALYHHFSGKQAVFEAVFEHVEADAARQIMAALEDPRPMAEGDGGAAGIPPGRPGADVPADRDPGGSRDPRLRAVPRAGGAIDVRHRAGHRALGARVVDLQLDDAMVETFSRIFFGAMSAAGESVSTAEDPGLASARVEAAIGFLLTGIRTLAEQGVSVPDPASAPHA